MNASLLVFFGVVVAMAAASYAPNAYVGYGARYESEACIPLIHYIDCIYQISGLYLEYWVRLIVQNSMMKNQIFLTSECSI